MSEFDNQTYLQNKVNPILHQLCVALLGSKPDKVVDFMVDWLQSQGQFIESGIPKDEADNDDSIKTDSSDEEDDEVFELPSKLDLINQKKGQVMRTSVSAEAYGSYNKKGDFKLVKVDKSEDAKLRIKDKLTKSFMFAALELKELNMVVDAMEIKQFQKGDMIINEGDDGDYLYVVEEGQLECTKIIQGESKFLKMYGPGEAFGELALLYNAPRAATIKADSVSTLFALNRDTFNNVVKDAAVQKRNRYESFLSKIELLDTMNPYERTSLADVIKSKQYKKSEYIIREGEKGNTFYFIESGECVATKKKNGKEEIVFKYKSGDYFGELALLKNQPRAASIICVTECTVVFLDRNSFKRLLGPLDDILKRNMTRYEKYALQ